MTTKTINYKVVTEERKKNILKNAVKKKHKPIKDYKIYPLEEIRL